MTLQKMTNVRLRRRDFGAAALALSVAALARPTLAAAQGPTRSRAR